MNSTHVRRTAAWSSAALAACLWLGACAPMSETQCRAADWYQLGYRDGDIYGLRPQIDQYAYQCRAHGVQAQEPAYMAGWVDGFREWNTRVMGSECCGSR
jgi:uncharacterized protein DUF2799